MNYNQAATLLTKLGEVNSFQGTDISQVQPIPYWENLFANSAGTLSGCAPNSTGITNPTATQAMYDAYFCGLHNETTPQFIADLFCFPGCANGKLFQYFQSQFASLYAWSSIGRSNYNAGQFSLRRRATHGLSWDFNYTYSKSMDIGSNAERVSLFEGFGFGSQVINAFQPGQLRAVSDYDTTHQINTNWVYEFPLGRGKKWGANWSRGLDAIAGGWAVSGLAKWTSGFPFNVGNGFDFPTNWELTGNAITIGKPKTGTFTDVDGDPNVFEVSATAAGRSTLVPPNSPFFRFPYPGESGSRNSLRGPGYFGIDMALRKTWGITERTKLAFSWEVFNITNSVRFDAANTFPAIDSEGSFGKFANTLTRPRVMEFALRLSF
jgi:hypothetical protein